ncbi:amino acid ABC transporter substrate-binding protein [Virgibacillus dokdonensis]|uniref:Amino acid ABC transporter substrate-binding protein n=1 Tax=Virgibacillus dokdonensis TaxID=302167 RepID=A0A3E0WT44_9BACI|nr:transporter substrate-binding domain-containing protein [Virgibacillus dokdonensis]RFA36008.1 amino acid ABC transporter substrate-binding protein [Virgibacillus dokdonensis]
MKYIKISLILIASIVFITACSNSAGDSNSEDENSETDKRWQEVKEKGELVVGTSGTLIAASYYDGEEESEDQLTGYDVEVMREVAKRLEVDISFEIMGIDSMLPAIKSGRIDVAANDIEATDKRKESFNFSEPYKYSYSTMVVRKEDNSGIESLEDLKGKIAGGGATTIYSQIAEHFGAKVKTYGNAPNEAYLRDVHNGRSDVIVNDYYLSKFGVAGFPEFDIHLHPDLKFHPTEQAVVIAKDADKFTEKINDALAAMREDGTLSELAKKFYQEDASQKPEGDIQEIEGLDL